MIYMIQVDICDCNLFCTQNSSSRFDSVIDLRNCGAKTQAHWRKMKTVKLVFVSHFTVIIPIAMAMIGILIVCHFNWFHLTV